MNIIKNSILTAILFSIIAFSSCSKNSSDSKFIKNSEVNKTTQKLLDFKDRLNSKNRSVINADSAEWYVEGLLNYELANNTHEFENLTFIKDTITFPSENGSISYENLNNIYLYISELADSIKQSSMQGYNFDIIDLKILNTDWNNQGIAITLSGGIYDVAPINFQFGDDDYWFWSGKNGKCGDYTGQFIGRDATTELQRAFNSKVKPADTYYVSIESNWALPTDHATNDNPYGHFMIYAFQEDCNYCIGPDELNYYLSKFDYIKEFHKPIGKEFINVTVQMDGIVGKGCKSLCHSYLLYYGKDIVANPN